MKKLKAFTLVETLIVIVVFCIGILTVLFWLSQTLRNKDYAKIQIQSAFFAREWIEMMFNLRDANYHKELPWNCITQLWMNANWCKENFTPNTILKIWIWSDDEYINVEKDSMLDFSWMFEGYQIYLHTWNTLNNSTWFIYNHNAENGEETWFARYIKISWVSNWWWNIDPNKLIKIESHVLYKKWGLTWEKVMETFMWNYEF